MKDLKIHFLNTIWSDAIIIEYHNHYGFVDTGSKFYFPMIDEYLKKLNIKQIDFIILTHFHSDHYGNVANIIKHYQVDKLYLKHYHGLDGTTASGFSSNEEYIENEFKNYNEIIDACNHKTQIIYIDDCQNNNLDIDFYGVTIELYDTLNRLYELYSNPNSSFYLQKKFNENFNSACVFIKHNNFNIFLGADVTCSKTDIQQVKALSVKILKSIYKRHQIDHIDLYKSCHHGGGGTNPKELCDLLKSRYCVITNTSKWLDTYDTFDNLKSAFSDVKILTTDHQKYIFTIGNEITYKTISEESLFITLNKD